jgi:molecular chaperone GrpE (heat shock protein)
MPVDKVITKSDEFASAMQQLSAEAAKVPPAPPETHDSLVISEKGGEMLNRVHALDARVQGLEKALSDRLDKLASAISTSKSLDLSQQFQKIGEELAAIRSTESVNKQLFDSLHAELLKYRDNFLHESLQKPFIHDLMRLYDDLNSLGEQLRGAAQEKNGKRGHVTQWRDNLENAIHSLVEILHRLEVKEIEPKEHVDLAYHRVVSYEAADFPEDDGRIVMRVKRGFFWRGNLIRPEEVIAKRFG